MEKMLTETKKKIEKTRKDILNWGDKHSKCTDKHNVMLGAYVGYLHALEENKEITEEERKKLLKDFEV